MSTYNICLHGKWEKLTFWIHPCYLPTSTVLFHITQLPRKKNNDLRIFIVYEVITLNKSESNISDYTTVQQRLLLCFLWYQQYVSREPAQTQPCCPLWVITHISISDEHPILRATTTTTQQVLSLKSCSMRSHNKCIIQVHKLHKVYWINKKSTQYILFEYTYMTI